MYEVKFNIDAKELKKALKGMLKDKNGDNPGCYFFFKDYMVKIVSREWILNAYEIYTDIKSNVPLRMTSLLVAIEDIDDMLNHLKKKKKRFFSGIAIFDEFKGFIEIEGKKIIAFHV